MTHHWTKPMSFRKKVFCNVCRKKIHSQGVLCEGRFVSCMTGEIIFFFFHARNNCQWQQLVGTVLHPETSQHFNFKWLLNTYFGMASEDTLLVMELPQRALNNWYMFSHSPPSPLPLFPSLSPSSLYSPPSPLPLFPSLSPSSIPLPLLFLYSPPSPLLLFPSLSPSSIPVCKYYAHQKCQDNAFDDCKHCATYHSGASVSNL